MHIFVIAFMITFILLIVLWVQKRVKKVDLQDDLSRIREMKERSKFAEKHKDVARGFRRDKKEVVKFKENIRD